MTTGRPRLEKTINGALILYAVDTILGDHPDATPSTVAYELRRHGVKRLSGDTNWTERSARRAMERLGWERSSATNIGIDEPDEL
jgi:hypothetical protein